jgi:hypothetical protein
MLRTQGYTHDVFLDQRNSILGSQPRRLRDKPSSSDTRFQICMVSRKGRGGIVCVGSGSITAEEVVGPSPISHFLAVSWKYNTFSMITLAFPHLSDWTFFIPASSSNTETYCGFGLGADLDPTGISHLLGRNHILISCLEKDFGLRSME